MTTCVDVRLERLIGRSIEAMRTTNCPLHSARLSARKIKIRLIAREYLTSAARKVVQCSIIMNLWNYAKNKV